MYFEVIKLKVAYADLLWMLSKLKGHIFVSFALITPQIFVLFPSWKLPQYFAGDLFGQFSGGTGIVLGRTWIISNFEFKSRVDTRSWMISGSVQINTGCVENQTYASSHKPPIIYFLLEHSSTDNLSKRLLELGSTNNLEVHIRITFRWVSRSLLTMLASVPLVVIAGGIDYKHFVFRSHSHTQCTP